VDDVVGVTVAPNEAEAEIICGLLRSEGIECSYRQTNVGAGAFDGMPGGSQEVLVPASDLERARQVFAARPNTQ
jgi:Putative prokaryotic signal transducing protein